MWKVDRKKCLRCGACVSVCPFLALELKENGLVFHKELCTECGLCEKVCPVGAIKVKREKNEQRI